MTAMCVVSGCGRPAVARVANPLLPDTDPRHTFVLVRPAATPNPVGYLLCLDHTHHTIDLMLMAATPTEETPR